MSINTPKASVESTNDARAELAAWYDELEQNLQQQEACEDLPALERLQEDEAQIISVIVAMEKALAAPSVESVNAAVQQSQTAVSAVVRTEVEGALQPEVAATATAEIAEESFDDQCNRLVDQLAGAETVDDMTTVFLATRPDVLLQWATHVTEWIQFDVEGSLSGAWDKRIQLWMQALSAAKHRLPAFVDHGVLTGRQAGDGIRACNQSRELLQAILRQHFTADEKEGPSLGRRNKPSVVTGNGDFGTIRPINKTTARGTWVHAKEDDADANRATA